PTASGDDGDPGALTDCVSACLEGAVAAREAADLGPPACSAESRGADLPWRLRFVDLRDQTVEHRVRIEARAQQHHARMAHATRPLRFFVQLSEYALIARLNDNRYIEHPPSPSDEYSLPALFCGRL